MSEPLLAVDKIETRYGLSQVLFGISLAISAGEMVTLMGRNGMGKTTTVRSIMGLTPATAGSIRFGGQEIASLPSFRVAQARHRPRARGPADLPEPHHAREPGRDRGELRQGVRPVDARQGAASCFRGSASGSAAWAIFCPAASSRCWRSAAR